METFQCGPCAGEGGVRRVDNIPDGRSLEVAAVRVWSGDFVDAIQLVYRVDGTLRDGIKHGGNGGTLVQVDFDKVAPEFLIGIRGESGRFVDSVTLVTNRQTFGQNGRGRGPTEYVFEVPEDFEVIGLSSKSGDFLDGLGVIYRRRPNHR